MGTDTDSFVGSSRSVTASRTASTDPQTARITCPATDSGLCVRANTTCSGVMCWCPAIRASSCARAIADLAKES
nr:hypothetical protein GCM10020241_55860 [Streptoalloteichus tenebrarius]